MGTRGLNFTVRVAIVLALGAAWAFPGEAAASARAGTLDQSFGNAGKVIAASPPPLVRSKFGSEALDANGNLLIEVQRDSKQGVWGENGIREIERRSPDGSLDPTFGNGGKVPVNGGAGVTTRADGDILVGVSSCDGKRSSAMLLDPRGVAVSSFGRKGCGAALPFDTSIISVDAAGRILLAGTFLESQGRDLPVLTETEVARLLPDGSRDPSFGTKGVVPLGRGEPTGIVPTLDGGATVAVDGDLIRLDGAGVPVPSFGNKGTFSSGGSIAGLLALPDGSFVVSSTVNEGSEFARSDEVVVSHVRSDGSLDPEFGTGGAAHLALPEGATAGPIAASRGNGLLVAGELEPDDNCVQNCAQIPILARFGPGGQLDPNYGKSGVAELPAPKRAEYEGALGLSALVVTPDGSGFLAGGEEIREAFLVARSPEGLPPNGFGEEGALLEPHYRPPSLEVTGLVIGSRDSITVAAEGAAGTQELGGFLLDFADDGQQESAESDGGVFYTAPRGSLLPNREGLLVSASEFFNNAHALTRHGEIVPGYGKEGVIEFPYDFQSRAFDDGPDGSVTVVGSAGEQEGMEVFRIGADGRPVTTFGDKGLAMVDFGQNFGVGLSSLVEADGDVVVSGGATGGVATARLLPNGRLDRHYGHGGRVRDVLGGGAYGTQIAPFHGGVVIAAAEQGELSTFAGLFRLDRDGHLVSGFGEGGKIRFNAGPPPLAVFTRKGRIVVVTPQSGGGVELRAYRPDGSPERRFGHRGIARATFGPAGHFDPAAAVQQPNGEITVAGSLHLGRSRQVALVRFR